MSVGGPEKRTELHKGCALDLWLLWLCRVSVQQRYPEAILVLAGLIVVIPLLNLQDVKVSVVSGLRLHAIGRSDFRQP